MKKKSIVIIAYTQISTDARVIRAAKAASEADFSIDFYTLNEDNSFSIDGVNIIRSKQYQIRAGFIKYIISYLKFFLFCLYNVSKNYFKKRYAVCHINNMPNFLVFSCIIPKLFGAKLILDVHDLIEELMEVRFCNKNFRSILRFEERISANFCDVIISVNELHKERFKKIGIRKKIIPILNISDSKSVDNIGKKFNNKTVKIVYAATITKQVGIETLIYSIYKLRERINNFKLFIYGDGPSLKENIRLVNKLNLNNIIIFSKRWLPFNELSNEYDNAHIGVVPTSRNRLTDLCLGAKTTEYYAKKIAVVLSDTLSHNHYFSDCALLFKAGDPKDLADKLYMLIKDRELMKEYAEKGYEYYLKNPWSKYKKRYMDLLNELANKKGRN